MTLLEQIVLIAIGVAIGMAIAALVGMNHREPRVDENKFVNVVHIYGTDETGSLVHERFIRSEHAEIDAEMASEFLTLEKHLREGGSKFNRRRMGTLWVMPAGEPTLML